MKKLTQYFLNKNILFINLQEIKPTTLKSKKKVSIYHAISVDNNYYTIFIPHTKSRFIIKNANEIMEMCNKLIDLKGHNYKKKILLISSPLCSKAKKLLKENGWSVNVDFM